MSPLPTRRRITWLSALAAPLLALAVVPTSTGPLASAQTRASSQPEVTTLWVDAPDTAERIAAPRAVTGAHRLVTLRASGLSSRTVGERVAFPLGARTSFGRVTTVRSTADYTSWTGTLDDDPLGTFAMVRVGSVYRAEVISTTRGAYDVRQASGDRYWLTTVGPQPAQLGKDSATGPAPRVRHASRPSTTPALARKRGAKSRVDVMFAYTKSALQTAGSKAQLKADAALVITQTNQTLEDSGDRVTMRYRGLVRAKGTEGKNPINDAFRIARPHDGHFDALQKLRARHHADLIHMFTGGASGRLDGGGVIPYTPAQANPGADASVSNLDGLPYLVSTHELGHNLGADHIDYPGVAHNSRDPHAYGFYNVPGNYLTVMGYYDPCYDVGVYSCVRVPWFSSPTNTMNGQPLGLNKATNNTLVVAKTAPHVARYAR